MPRKIGIVAAGVLGAEVLGILLFGTSPAGTFAANFLQSVACALAVAAAIGASRRGEGLSRSFWRLIALGIGTWGIANLGWMYYENWLRVPVPPLSFVRFLFESQGAFFAIALFLEKEKDLPSFDLEALLDSLQIVIVYFCAFFGFYYVQLLRGAAPASADAFMTAVYIALNAILTVIAAVVTGRAHTARVKLLYGNLTAFLFFYTVASGIADYVQSARDVPTGTWYDLLWTGPFLWAAVWAAKWKEPAETGLKYRHRTIGGFATRNVTLALAPLIVLVLVAQLTPEWRLTGFVVLGISISCYAARLGVSEYRQIQAAETVMRHRLALDSTVDGMAILDSTGKHIYVNSAFAKMMGHANPETMLNRPWREIYNAADIARSEKLIQESINEHGRWFGPLTIHHADGTAFPIELAVTALPDGGTVCVSRDIRPRLTAERAQFDAETKYRTLVEQVAAISYIAELGVHGIWHYVSPQVEEMFGFTAEEWLAGSTDWIRHVLPEDHQVIAAAEEASKRGERFQAEYRLIRKDGQVIWVNDTAIVASGSDSHPVMEGVIVDITERKQLEGQLQQSRRMEAVGRLAGGIAHDFNNLLTIIKGYTELALNRARNYPEVHSDIERIEDAAERAAALVRQLLAFSRRQVLQPKLLDLNSIVVGLDKLLRRLMDEDIEMLTFVSDGLGTIKADPGQIEQVIMNLVVNARDAMPKGGRLTVETANVELDGTYAKDHASVRPGRYVMLSVTDTGIGMDADTVTHIFEPFYTTKESGRGTGLGLSTVYGIVKQSGGYIWVYSEPRQGSSFKVYLPRVDKPAEVLGPGKRTVLRKGTETILLVEDEPAVRELTRMILAEQGYFVIEAASPEDAERICENDGATIHLLLTDVIMPGMSGRDLAKRLTARYANLRVLYMSGYTYNVMATGGMLEDGIAFLQKPFTPSTLAEKVREVLDATLPAR